VSYNGRDVSVEAIGSIVLAAVVVIVLVYALPRMLGGGYIKCTRCDGTGQIDERWPDPTQPTGFHVANGTCPKCKGKGRIRT
jgi:hypothetical protein